jgi:hypothetical protein
VYLEDTIMTTANDKITTPPRSHASSPLASYAAVLRESNDNSQSSLHQQPKSDDDVELLTPPKSYNGTPPEGTPDKNIASASDMLASIMNDIQQIAQERDGDDAHSGSQGTAFDIFRLLIW